MSLNPTRFALGAAIVSVLHLGTLRVQLADWLGLAEVDWPPEHRSLFSGPIGVPVQAVHIALPGRSVLVDVCHPELLAHVEQVFEDVPQPSGLLDQLATIGVEPDGVDSVVITHPHFDHYCGLIAVGPTPEADRLLFANARHYLGRADWDQLGEQLADAASPISRTFGLASRHGLFELVDEARDLGDGISVLPTPGETPGHQSVRVESAGQVLYILGDLYHHAVEIEQEAWGVRWADQATVARSRASITAAALAEGALLLSTHIPGVGRLERSDVGLRWAPLDSP